MNWTHSELLRRGPMVPRPIELKINPGHAALAALVAIGLLLPLTGALSRLLLPIPLALGLLGLQRFVLRDRGLYERGAVASAKILDPDGLRLDFVFKVDGVAHQMASENITPRWSGSMFPRGGKVAVFYDPVDPRRCVLYGAGCFDIQRG